MLTYPRTEMLTRYLVESASAANIMKTSACIVNVGHRASAVWLRRGPRSGLRCKRSQELCRPLHRMLNALWRMRTRTHPTTSFQNYMRPERHRAPLTIQLRAHRAISRQRCTPSRPPLVHEFQQAFASSQRICTPRTYFPWSPLGFFFSANVQ